MSHTTTPENVAATFCATLVDEWVHHGVRHAVIAPGSRSTPMALALASRSDVSVHVFHDERAAAFAALGIGQLGVPAILLCTSGTAAAHFHGAVIEAHLSAIPLIVCTADRPPELRDVGAPQTIDQTKLYGGSVRWFHDPGVAANEASQSWRPLAAHVFSMAVGHWPGPVHLNLSFREPLVGVAGELPERTGSNPVTLESSIVASEHTLDDLANVVNRRRGVVVAGRGCGSASAINELASTLGWPVFADARSGLRHLVGVALGATDAVLRSPGFANSHRPDVVLRLGEPPASKVLNQWLAGCAAAQIHVTAVPTWTDPEGVVSIRVVADPSDLCRSLTSKLSAAHLIASREPREVDDERAWLGAWIGAERVAQAAISAALTGGELTEPNVARCLVRSLAASSHLVVSSSMPIRDVEWFGAVPEGVTVHCNRGANGIDGVIATAIGVALAAAAPTTLLIGDVAFLHDSSALIGLTRRNIDLRIVVVDNDGGGIFSFLAQSSVLAPDRFEQLFGTPHGVDLAALASAHGIVAVTAASEAELLTATADTGPTVTIVESNRTRNVAVHESIHAAVVAALEAARLPACVPAGVLAPTDE